MVASPAVVASEDQESTGAISVEGLNLFYRDHQALRDISLKVPGYRVTSLIGPSGCGKSSFLRCLNRMNDLIPTARVQGSVIVDGIDAYARGVDLMKLRRRVGMVFQRPNPFPMTIFENVAIALRLHYGMKRAKLEEFAQAALEQAGLWHEVKDVWRRKSALELSGGQQQRLCIARSLAVRPKILLMDEPCSALDPASSAVVEQLIQRLVHSHTIVMVTHNLQQARRVSDEVVMFLDGRLVERGAAGEVFGNPRTAEMRDYVAGIFG